MLTASGDSGHNKAFKLQHNLVNKVCAIIKIKKLTYIYYMGIQLCNDDSASIMPLHCSTYIATGQTVTYSHRTPKTAAKAHPHFTRHADALIITKHNQADDPEQHSANYIKLRHGNKTMAYCSVGNNNVMPSLAHLLEFNTAAKKHS